MVEQRSEPRPLVPTCYFTHTAQLAGPALSPGRGRLPDVLLGRSPSLHALRRCLLTLVRTLRGYYSTVRLPINDPCRAIPQSWSENDLSEPSSAVLTVDLSSTGQFQRDKLEL